MEKDNCELLFEYLRSILYDSQIQQLDVQSLDEPFQKLGKGLAFLQQCVEEMHTYTAELSKGNLSEECPERDNSLCVNLKNLHANLKHLTWQAKQVAAGDYSQQVSYLGEFSEAFNTMTAQLKEREALLKKEAEKMQKRAEIIEEYNELLVEVTRKRKEWILVVDAETRDVVYCNKRRDEKQVDPGFCETCEYRLSFHNKILAWQDNEQYKEWELGDEEQGFYRVTTFHIEWRGRNAYAHIVADITEDKYAAEQLNSKAYYDSITGIHNRLYFEEYMQKSIEDKKDITLCYLDIDGLKAVNDKYGHNEGDSYIRSFVSIISDTFRSSDVFTRIGGDEFCIIMENACKKAMEIKLAKVSEQFAAGNEKEYRAGFSYGVVEVIGRTNTLTLEDIIRQADLEMYQCKRKNKGK